MKRRVAHAIGYDAERDSAPRVLASAQGEHAERLLAIARESGVEIVENGVLASLLENVETGSLVPPVCWKALAEILAVVMAEEQR